MSRAEVMRFPKSVVKNALRKLARSRAQERLQRLRSVECLDASKIADAIDDALYGRVSPEEEVWIDRIEELRSELIADSSEICVTDYGAGHRRRGRTRTTVRDDVVSFTNVSEVCSASKSPFWSLVLFMLVRRLEPTTLIELGTCLGVSAAYQAAALKINGKGSLTTMEGAAPLADLSERNLQTLGLDNAVVVCGRFQDKLDGVLKENRPIDYAFIDGHHDENATISYYDSFVPNLSSNAIIVLDDISWSDGMRRAWNRILETESVKFSVDLRGMGICLLDSDTNERRHYRIPLV